MSNLNTLARHMELVRAMNPIEAVHLLDTEFEYWPKWAQRDAKLAADFERLVLELNKKSEKITKIRPIKVKPMP